MNVAPNKRKSVVVTIGVCLVLAVILFFSAGFPVCRDWGFIDENTGSRKGYREWCLGFRTGPWYQPSAVDMFMQTQHASQLQHRWTSYAGTGRNIFGAKVLYGHGRPGAIIQVSQPLLNQWFDLQQPAEKRAFYDLLASDDQAAIQSKIASIYDSATNAPPK